jgi:hypothetical protein
MNITKSGRPTKPEFETDRPDTASGRQKDGTGVPSGSIVESTAIESSRVCEGWRAVDRPLVR